MDASTQQTSPNFEQVVVNVRSRMADASARLLRALADAGGEVMLEQQQDQSRTSQGKARVTSGQLGQFHSQVPSINFHRFTVIAYVLKYSGVTY
jgi:hypothetical protein